MNHDIILKRFEQPDELREFEKGRFEVIHFDEMTIGPVSYTHLTLPTKA